MDHPVTSRRKVLLVEDDLLAARVAEKILERLGYDVCAVLETGEEAVARAASLAPDVVLMDINLAGPMDGVAAARAIIDAVCVPVIFLTASVDPDIMTRVAETGAAGYIQKPVKLLDFKANLEMALARSRRGEPCCPCPGSGQNASILAAVLKTWDRALAVVATDGQVLFAYPDAGAVGTAFATFFASQPAVPAAGDTPCLDASGQVFAWLRLLSA